jgi:predicted TIM-barrel fold metal-dependent hydrolase
MLITDAQVHIWEEDRPDRPWPKRNIGVAQKPHGYSAEEMLAEMKVAGVDRAVIVPPTYVGEGNETALEVHQQYPQQFAIMGRIDIKRPDLKEALASWKQQPGMLGIRQTFYGQFRDWFDAGDYEPFWTAAEESGVPVMCLTHGFPEALGPILERHPGLTLIVDHFGAYLDKKGDEAFAMMDRLLPLAKYPNFYVKVTSAPCISADPYPFIDIYPYMRQIYEVFGPQRMMWGADITRLTSTYTECLNHFREGLDFLTSDDKEWILGKTVATVLNWPE